MELNMTDFHELTYFVEKCPEGHDVGVKIFSVVNGDTGEEKFVSLLKTTKSVLYGKDGVKIALKNKEKIPNHIQYIICPGVENELNKSDNATLIPFAKRNGENWKEGNGIFVNQTSRGDVGIICIKPLH